MKPAEERRALRELRETRAELTALEPLLLEVLAMDDQTSEPDGFGMSDGPGGRVPDPVHASASKLVEAITRLHEGAQACRTRAHNLSSRSRRARDRARL